MSRLPSPRAARCRTTPGPVAGAQKTVAPFQPGELLRLRDPTEPVDAVACDARRDASVSGPSEATHSTASRSSPVHTSSRTPSPFRGSCRPRTSHSGRDDGVGSTLAKRRRRHRSEHEIRASQRLFGHRLASGLTATRTSSRRAAPTASLRRALYAGLPASPAAWNVPTLGSHCPAARRSSGRARAVVQMQHVRFEDAERLERALGRDRLLLGHGRDRAVGREADARTHRGDTGLGWWAVGRPDAERIDPHARARPGRARGPGPGRRRGPTTNTARAAARITRTRSRTRRQRARTHRDRLASSAASRATVRAPSARVPRSGAPGPE